MSEVNRPFDPAELPNAGDACEEPRLASSRQTAITAAVLLVVLALVYLQWRAWQHFDWSTFWLETRGLDWWRVLSAVGLIYSTYFIRALRWKIFLRPTREVPAMSLVAPTIVGFTGLALLGRPGELVRPCLIARRTDISVPAQLGVWTVERIFDLGAYALIAAVTIFTAQSLPALHGFRIAGVVFVAAVIGLAVGAVVMRRSGPRLFPYLHARFGHAPGIVRSLLTKAETFVEGLNTIHDLRSFIQLAVLSCAMWLIIAMSYFEISHAYPSLRYMPYSYLVMVMGFSMIGGLAQLPAVGGGAQIATIAALALVFHVPHELAVSCGILFWLVGFQSVTPAGLILARKQHLSLRNISTESETRARDAAAAES